MLKSFLKNSIIYYISGLLSKGISFFLLPLYTSLLTTRDYGVLELLSIVSTLSIIIFTFQINQAVARFYNELINQKHIQMYTSTVAIFSLTSFATFLLLGLIFVNPVSLFIGLPVKSTVLALLSITLNALFYLSQNQLTWKIKPFQEMISSLVYNISTIGSTILLLVVYKQGVEGILIAQCIGAVLGIITGVVFTRKDFSLFFSIKLLKKLFQFSLPLIPSALSAFLFLFTDRICIKEILGMDELGVFTVGNKIASILTLASLGASSALSPLIYKHYKDPKTPDKIAFLFRIFSVLTISLMAFLSLFSKELLHILTPASYHSAHVIIPFLTFVLFLSTITLFFPGLSLSKRTKMISTITVISGSLNLIFNLLLVEKYGIVASSAVSAGSYLINFSLFYYFSQKEYKINVNIITVFFVILLLFTLTGISNYFELGILVNLAFFILIAATSLIIIKKEDYLFLLDKIKRK